MERGVVTGECIQDDGECREHDHVDGTIDRNEPEDVTVPEHRPPLRDLDLASVRHPVSGRLERRGVGDPGVAPQAPVPADSVHLANQHGVVGFDVGDIRAHQGMTPPPARQQLVEIVRSPRPLLPCHLSTIGSVRDIRVKGEAMKIDVDTHVGRIERDGYTIVEDAIELDLVEAIVDDLLRLEHDLGVVPASNDFEGVRTTRVYNLLAHGARFAQITVHPGILPICERVLDPGLLVSSLSSIAIGTGETPQPIHADDQIIPLPKPHLATVCNTMWALTEFTEANGATRIIPGTHTAASSPDLSRHYDSIPAEMGRGSVLVWHGSLWHGGGANTTSSRRIGIAMNYCAGYLRQQENQQLGLSVDTVRRFSPRLQQLVGYGIYRGLIGHIDKQIPANLLLEASEDSRLVWE